MGIFQKELRTSYNVLACCQASIPGIHQIREPACLACVSVDAVADVFVNPPMPHLAAFTDDLGVFVPSVCVAEVSDWLLWCCWCAHKSIKSKQKCSSAVQMSRFLDSPNRSHVHNSKHISSYPSQFIKSQTSMSLNFLWLSLWVFSISHISTHGIMYSGSSRNAHLLSLVASGTNGGCLQSNSTISTLLSYPSLAGLSKSTISSASLTAFLSPFFLSPARSFERIENVFCSGVINCQTVASTNGVVELGVRATLRARLGGIAVKRQRSLQVLTTRFRLVQFIAKSKVLFAD